MVHIDASRAVMLLKFQNIVRWITKRCWVACLHVHVSMIILTPADASMFFLFKGAFGGRVDFAKWLELLKVYSAAVKLTTCFESFKLKAQLFCKCGHASSFKQCCAWIEF